MTKTNDTATGDFAADLAALRTEVSKLADTIGSLVTHQTNAAGARVSQVAADAGSRISETAAEAKSQFRAASAKVEAGIEHNPLTAVLIAFGIGMSLALVSRARG